VKLTSINLPKNESYFVFRHLSRSEVRGQANDSKRSSGMVDATENGFGQKLRLARQRAGMTQEDLAARISRTPESISNIERGLQEPGIKTVQSLAMALGLPLSELLVSPQEEQLTPKRMQMEFQLRDLARGLTDRDLAIALGHVQVLLAVK
jgi:transcriptional regulator with XRE-family HTH domain